MVMFGALGLLKPVENMKASYLLCADGFWSGTINPIGD